ncbi:MAG: hypothetical protein JSU07_13190 [Bacteroidetes bacterium]|nr:hypothetical protein [Bacteroidota bacterium]
MKTIVSISLILSVLALTFSKTLIFSNYFFNKEVITQKFCKNKSKPTLKCNGKCHLNRLITENEKNNNQTKSNINNEEIQSYAKSLKIELNLTNALSSVINTNYFLRRISKIIFPIFHPPALSLI